MANVREANWKSSVRWARRNRQTGRQNMMRAAAKAGGGGGGQQACKRDCSSNHAKTSVAAVAQAHVLGRSWDCMVRASVCMMLVLCASRAGKGGAGVQHQCAVAAAVGSCWHPPDNSTMASALPVLLWYEPPLMANTRYVTAARGCACLQCEPLFGHTMAPVTGRCHSACDGTRRCPYLPAPVRRLPRCPQIALVPLATGSGRCSC